MSAPEEDAEKSFEASPQKLQKAREKGEVPRSSDLFTAAGYFGLIVACVASGGWVVETLGTALTTLLEQPHALAANFFSGSAAAPVGGLLQRLTLGTSPMFGLPLLFVVLTIIGQRALFFTPSKLAPKLSRISLLSNFKNKFGRNGLFEFSKSAAKLFVFSAVLGAFLILRLEDILATMHSDPGLITRHMVQLCLAFFFVIFCVALFIGAIDWTWQYVEHLRQNRMTRQELMDETKDAEGDPHLKNERRQRGQSIASNRMMADVPTSDVVIVNPTHYAVALKWSREPGSAPICVAKGVDETAAAIRSVAAEAGVPIHSDPPTARALHATVEIGAQIMEEHFQSVAIAIRFAEDMRRRARNGL